MKEPPVEQNLGTRLAAVAAALLIGIVTGAYAVSAISNFEVEERGGLILLSVLTWVIAALAAAMLPFGETEERNRGKGLVGSAMGIGILIAAVLRAMGPDVTRNLTPALLALISGWFGTLAVRVVLRLLRRR